MVRTRIKSMDAALWISIPDNGDRERVTDYISKPSEQWVATSELLSSTTLFLVNRIGPTVFGIKDETDAVYKITLGNPHWCSCGSCKKGKVCIHVLFCLIKVLKVPNTHTLCWQLSLTDPELDQVLSGVVSGRNNRNRSRPVRKAKIAETNGDTSPNGSFVSRQPIGEDGEESYCPICQDEMSNEQALSWCRKGCGNNVHANCMLKYAQYKITNKQDPTCPLCRENWEMVLLKQDCKGRAALKHAYAPIICSKCKCLQRNEFYRCIECSQTEYRAVGAGPAKPIDFCPDCFAHRMNISHLDHHFLCSEAAIEAHSLDWASCPNPLKKSAPLDPVLMHNLQNRELGVNDYELLLQLDAANQQGWCADLPTTCVKALPEFKNSIKSPTKIGEFARCWCLQHRSPVPDNYQQPNGVQLQSHGSSYSPQRDNSNGNNSIAIDDENRHSELFYRVLPCGHIAHENCLMEEIGYIITEDSGRISDYRCQHEGCGKRIFGGLSRKRKKKAALLKTRSSKNLSKEESKPIAEALSNITLNTLNIVGNPLNAVENYHNNPTTRYNLTRSNSSNSQIEMSCNDEIEVNSNNHQRTLQLPLLSGRALSLPTDNKRNTLSRSDKLMIAQQQQLQQLRSEQRSQQRSLGHHRQQFDNYQYNTYGPGAVDDVLDQVMTVDQTSQQLQRERHQQMLNVRVGQRPPILQRNPLRALGEDRKTINETSRPVGLTSGYNNFRESSSAGSVQFGVANFGSLSLENSKITTSPSKLNVHSTLVKRIKNSANVNELTDDNKRLSTRNHAKKKSISIDSGGSADLVMSGHSGLGRHQYTSKNNAGIVYTDSTENSTIYDSPNRNGIALTAMNREGTAPIQLPSIYNSAIPYDLHDNNVLESRAGDNLGIDEDNDFSLSITGDNRKFKSSKSAKHSNRSVGSKGQIIRGRANSRTKSISNIEFDHIKSAEIDNNNNVVNIHDRITLFGNEEDFNGTVTHVIPSVPVVSNRN